MTQCPMRPEPVEPSAILGAVFASLASAAPFVFVAGARGEEDPELAEAGREATAAAKPLASGIATTSRVGVEEKDSPAPFVPHPSRCQTDRARVLKDEVAVLAAATGGSGACRLPSFDGVAPWCSPLEEFVYIHDGLALPCMRRPEALGLAFWHLHRANTVHVEATGNPSPEALYNMACCFSLAADAGLRGYPAALPSLGLPASTKQEDILPPRAKSEGAESNFTELCLDRGVSALRAAMLAGYQDYAQIQQDDDLRALRELRADNVGDLLQWSRCVATTPVASFHGALPKTCVASTPVASFLGAVPMMA